MPESPSERIEAGDGAPPGAISGVARRVVAATDEMLQTICVRATDLMDRQLTAGERRECAATAAQLARWLGSMNLTAEAMLARQIETAFLAEDPEPADAVRVAGLVDDIRSSLSISVAEHRAGGGRGPDVVVIGDETPESDAHVWVIAAGGFACHAQTPWDPPGLYPETTECVVVLPQVALNATLVSALAERYVHVPVVVMADRADTERADQTDWATTIVEPTTSPEELVREVTWITRIGARRLRVGVVGKEAAPVARALQSHDAHVVAIGSLRDLGPTMRAESLEALVIGADVKDGLALAAVRRVRTDPELRDAVLVRQAQDPSDAHIHELYRLEVDAVIPEARSLKPAALATQLEALVTRTRRHEVLLSGGHRVLEREAAQIVIERMLVSAHRDGRTVSLALLEVPEESVDVDELLSDLAVEFRTDDVIGVWSPGRIVVALRGLTRRVALGRMQGVMERYGLVAHGARSGIAEFPYDARALDELVDVAAGAVERSRAADGPLVTGSDWRAEGSRVPDVMIVDADEILVSVLASHLRDNGLHTVSLFSGGDAAAWLLEDRRPNPRVLLLDFNLPGTDGLQLLRQLRKAGSLNRMRVLMLSATMRDDDLLEAFELGAVDVIRKPFSLVVFDNRLNRVLDS